ncbi:MAG: site-2 protease family protein [Thermomicrobia bacterium]|nr:site-2 protease family protein [Thermomicrobia bacterium]
MRAFRLTRVMGIDVRVHPTFALIVLWFAYIWGIKTGAGIGGVLFGLLMVVCLFACVLLHELGHCLVARRSNQVDGIAGMIGAVGQVDLPGFAAYLLFANLSLVVFNLIPAFPMDGGRILRAFMSLFISRSVATQIAVTIGKGIAICFVIVGFLVLHDWTLPMVGVFIFVGAHLEGRTVAMEEALRRMHVGQCITWEAGGIGPYEPLAGALPGGPRDLAVTERGRVIGILWKVEILNAMRVRGSNVRVHEVMDHFPPIVDVDTSLYLAQQAMVRADRGAVLVTERGVYRGILTAERYWYLHRLLQARRRSNTAARYWGWLFTYARRWRRQTKALSSVGRRPIL